MLVPFYWVLKTSVTGENIFVYPPSLLPVRPQPFYYVDTWYYIPFARYLANSVVVSALAVVANVIFNALAAYALTKHFKGRGLIITVLLSCTMIPFQTTIVPAYLITTWGWPCLRSRPSSASSSTKPASTQCPALFRAVPCSPSAPTDRAGRWCPGGF